MKHKYIEVDRLIAEIERIVKSYQDSEWQTVKGNTAKSIRNDLLRIITSLQEKQTEIEKEAEINPSMVSNFGPCAFNLSVIFTQDEMKKMSITPFFTKKVNVIIKDAE